MKLYTHQFVDLDAVCSVWAAVAYHDSAFSPQDVVFVPANWNGEGMEDGDVAVDLHAGGRGIKGEEKDGKVGSAFSLLVREYAPPEDQEALAALIRYVDVQDSTGRAIHALAPELSEETAKLLSSVSLNAVLHGVRESVKRSSPTETDLEVVIRMGGILDGMLAVWKSRRRAEVEADKATIVRGRVAIVEDSKEFATNAVLFERGIKAVVYRDGLNLGIVRSSREERRCDQLEIANLVRLAGESEEWFSHPAGFLYCRGSRKAPATTPSKVDVMALADVVASCFS